MYIQTSKSDQLKEAIEDYCKRNQISQQQVGFEAIVEFLRGKGYEIEYDEDLFKKKSSFSNERVDTQLVFGRIRKVLRDEGPMVVSDLKFYIPHSYAVIRRTLDEYQNYFIYEKMEGRKGYLIKLKDPIIKKKRKVKRRGTKE